MNKGGEQGPEQTASGKHDAKRIDGQRTGKVLPDGAAYTPGHPQRFNEAHKIVAEQDHIGALPRHIRAGAHRNTHARLDQGRSIVHAVAHHGDYMAVPLNETSNTREFFFGERFGNDFGDAKLARHGISDCPGIAREQERAYAHFVERVDGSLGLGAHCIRDSDHAKDLAVPRHEYIRCGFLVVPKRRRHGDTAVLHQRRVADENGCAVHKSRNAPARRVVKTLGLSDRTALRPYISNDGLAERMLGAQLGGGSRVQYFIRAHTLGGNDALNFRTPEGESAGLVDNHHIDPPKGFKMHAAFHDRAQTRATADSAQDGQRRSGGYAARAGDDDHRDRGDDIAGDQVSERRCAEGEVDEISGQPVGQPLYRRARAFGAFDSLDNLAITRVAADPLGADFESARLVD